MMYFFYFS